MTVYNFRKLITHSFLNMKKEDLRIVYMGTPDFAVEALRCLVEGGYNVVGVITMPDKPPAVDTKSNILR